MRKSLSKQKIDNINALLTRQKQLIDSRCYFQAEQQDEPLVNHHHYNQRQSPPRNAAQLQPTKSRVVSKVQANNKIDDIDELMNLQLKQESQLLKPNRFRKYEFTSKPSNFSQQSTNLPNKKTKSLSAINHDIVSQYFRNKIGKITASSKPAEVYQIFSPFYEAQGIEIEYPLVKLYKNCVYFGQHSKKIEQAYEGMIYFYNKRRLYYGGFSKDKKHGLGVEIDFGNDTVYIGSCTNGQKVGEFQVIKPNEQYVGTLVNCLYEGHGQLNTKWSVYRGEFQKGERHGQGKEYFPQTGLTLSGIFIRNQFSNDQQEIQQSRTKDHFSHRQDHNPESDDFLDFNYEFNERTQKANSFRVKRKGGSIVRQRMRRKSYEEEEPLAQSKILRKY